MLRAFAAKRRLGEVEKELKFVLRAPGSASALL